MLLLPGIAFAQDIPGAATGTGLDALTGGIGRNAITLLAVMTALSLAPGIAIMVTCFPFIVTVLSILRQSIGLQQSPPNQVLIGLSLFLSLFVMAPTLDRVNETAIAPYAADQIDAEQAIANAGQAFHAFMIRQTRL